MIREKFFCTCFGIQYLKLGVEEMYRKIIFFASILFVPLGYMGISIAGDPKWDGGGVRSCETISIDEKADPGPKTDEYSKLKEELERLMEEMKRLEKDFKDKLSKEILPLIRREIEKLRKRLKEFKIEGDEPKKIHINEDPDDRLI
ncbi:MAG: hypothetical protein ABII26_06230 [Pseudomonadota bacterium]